MEAKRLTIKSSNFVLDIYAKTNCNGSPYRRTVRFRLAAALFQNQEESWYKMVAQNWLRTGLTWRGCEDDETVEIVDVSPFVYRHFLEIYVWYVSFETKAIQDVQKVLPILRNFSIRCAIKGLISVIWSVLGIWSDREQPQIGIFILDLQLPSNMQFKFRAEAFSI